VSEEQITWPHYAAVLGDGYAIFADPDVVRTGFSDGMVRQEKRYAAMLVVRRVTAVLASDEALVQFRAWAAANAHRWFSWRDPEDGVWRRVRVRGGQGAIRYVARTAGTRRDWEMTCEIEGLAGRAGQIHA